MVRSKTPLKSAQGDNPVKRDCSLEISEIKVHLGLKLESEAFVTEGV